MLILHAANLAGVCHGFFGRSGGVSTGIYASLNCGPGSKDSREAVTENRRRVAAALKPEEHRPGKVRSGFPSGRATKTQLITLAQCHGADVRIVDEAWDADTRHAADGLVTNRPGIALGILTADCAPLLFADGRAGIVGAAHAGWKGAVGGVIEATLAAMEKLGARRSDIAAAIGPCISQANYEVGPEFLARFETADPANARFFAPSGRAGHHCFDLEAYALDRLGKAGIENAQALSACTYARPHDFFSFRRATHSGESDYGREISAIMLAE